MNEKKIEIRFDPLPKQKQFLETNKRFPLYAGGFGSGKTIAGAWKSFYLSMWFPRNYGLVGRMSYSQLHDTTQRELLNLPIIEDGIEVPLVESSLVKSFNKADNHLVFRNGSEILFRSLDDAFGKIKSLNLGWFWVDELTEANDEIWLGLVGRLRRQGVPHVGFGTTNPEGHDFVWKRWVANPHPDYYCVVAPSAENKHLPKGYVKSLEEQYPEEWVKRYVHGSFDTFSGLIYSSYRDEEPYLFDPVKNPIDDEWYQFVAMDYGYRNPTAVYWGAVDFNGNLWVYDEFYAPNKLVSEIAEIIKAKSSTRNVQQYLIDPSTRNRSGVTGRSVMDEFADYGVYLNPANNEVRAGINRVQEYLKLHNGMPKLRIAKTCVNLRSEMQMYRWKDLKAGATQDAPEKPVKKDDHAVDALRYMICYLYDTPVRTKKIKTALDYAWDRARHSSDEEYDKDAWLAA